MIKKRELPYCRTLEFAADRHHGYGAVLEHIGDYVEDEEVTLVSVSFNVDEDGAIAAYVTVEDA